MTRIGLISDTHGFLDDAIFKHFEKCNEIWHAGDFGKGVADRLNAESGRKVIRGVFGNIDDAAIRNEFPEQLVFICEEVKVMMKHIGGFPSPHNSTTQKES